MNRKLPKGLTHARMEPKSFNESERTVEVVFTTEAPVKRYDWMESKYYFEVLSMKKEHVRMERLLSGAPVLDSHDQYTGLRKQIGVVVSARLEGDQGIATLKLSDSTEERKSIIKDIKDGIYKNISVGYKIHKAEETIDNDSGMSTFRVIDWEPLEVSFVPVPADFKAQVRSEDDKELRQSFDCEIINVSQKGEGNMDAENVKHEDPASPEEEILESNADEIETPEEETEVEAEEVAEEEAAEEVEAEEAAEVEEEEGEKSIESKDMTTRTLEIMDLCKKNDMDHDFSRSLISKGVGVEEASKMIFEELERKEQEIKTLNTLEINDMDNKQKRMEAMARGLLNATSPTKYQLENGDAEYRTTSVQQAARMFLAKEMGEKNAFSLSNSEVAARALHHTSDFPLILENICNKNLMEGYSEIQATYAPFVRDRSVSDFKEVSESRVAMGGILPKVNEHGEYKRTTLASDGEKYRVEKRGEIIGMTEELLINDDLGAFTSDALDLGAKIARTENEVFWELVYTPQVMSDGLPLFHATHNNLGTAGAIGDTTLAEARTKSRLQKDIDGKTLLNIRPAYLVVPAAQENTALKFLTTVTPDSVANVNNFAQSMQLIVEPILDGASADAWYTLGSLSQGPMAVRARLDGMGPKISVRENWDIDGMETKIKYSFGMRIVDYRQFFKNAGV